MLKKSRCLVLAMVLILAVVSCNTFAAAKKPIKLVFGTVFSGDHYFVKADQYFKKLVEKNSKGQILIDYFPGGQLGNLNEMFQATKSGAQHLYLGGFPTAYLPKLRTFELSYLYRDEAHVLKVMDRLNSLIDKDEFVAKTGMRILGKRITSPRHLCTRFPVNKIEDIKGLKVRVPENALFLATWKALGAIPTTIPGPDTYMALATGTVDAAENPFSDIYMWKYQEILKYCALTSHSWGTVGLYINNDCWKSLTRKQQKIIANAGTKSSKYSEQLRKKSDEKYKVLLAKAGMKFTTPDLTPFRKKVRTIWGEVGDKELIKKIEAIK
jgi:TRAP-type C4-dicarboxylate transport system substrate-binding protein